jgi:alpha-2-macroglobulin-like protein
MNFERPISILCLALCLAVASPISAQGLASRIDKDLSAQGTTTLYVMTDKPIYHPGESMWFKAWEVSVRSPDRPLADRGMHFSLISPRGSLVMETRAPVRVNSADAAFDLDAALPGGQYVLKVATDLGAVHERQVLISSYEPPRIKKTLSMTRDAYGPGDEVTARIELHRATGGALSNHHFQGIVTIDGIETARVDGRTDLAGTGTLSFQLPDSMARGEGTLTVVVEEGGLLESIQRRIPIQLGRVQIQMYPEGGQLVAGVPGRVYFQARDLLGNTADIAGALIDDTGATLARFRTGHRGMGVVAVTPDRHRRYSLRVDKPRGTGGVFDLPAAQLQGCVLTATDPASHAAAWPVPDVKVQVRCSTDQWVTVTAVVRERLVASTAGRTGSGGNSFSLDIPDTQGTVRVTVFDDKHRPLSERLVYRGLGHNAQLLFQGDREEYSPGDEVTLTVRATDANGDPVAGEFGVAVVDDTVLAFADDRTAHLLARLYLEGEMPGQTIVDPNFYFSGDPSAAPALDLLLGTQGWRRFNWSW